MQTGAEQRQRQQPSFAAAAFTEVEDVEGGFTLLRPEEANREVSNVFEGEGLSRRENVLEEPGTEAGGEETQPMDAFFASYGELPQQVQQELISRAQQAEPEFGELREELQGRVPVNNTTNFPFRAICRLIITAKDNTRWHGTGFLVAPRTVITAGHCVFLHEHGGWARSIEVIPGLNKEQRPYGSAVARIFKTVTGWQKSKNRSNDYGAIILPQRSRLGDNTGTFGFAALEEEALNRATLNLADYPTMKLTRQAILRFLRQRKGELQEQYAGQIEAQQQQQQQFQGGEGYQQEGQQPQQYEQQQFGQQQEEQEFPRLRQGLQNLSNQMWFMALHARNVTQNQIRYDQPVQRGQSGAPVWIKTGNNRYVVGIHINSYFTGLAAIRITPQVFNNLSSWKQFGM